MRKILCLAAVLIMLFASISCNQNNYNIDTSDSNDTGLHYAYDQNSQYMSFEQLVNSATDIIKGRCIGVSKKDSYAEYEFHVVSRYLGEEVDGNIFVYVPDYNVSIINTNYSYKLSDLTYKEGFEYYLVLSRRVDVYLSHDRYINVGGNLFMPANDISQSTLYGESLIKHAQIKSINVEENLTEYLSRATKDMIDKNQVNAVKGLPYITDTDIASVINKSDFILRVKVEKEVYKGIADDRCTYDCEVTSSLKGSVNLNELVRIVFPKGSVEEGNEYILALTEFEGVTPRSFYMSSKNSIYEMSMQQYIVEHVQAK